MPEYQFTPKDDLDIKLDQCSFPDLGKTTVVYQSSSEFSPNFKLYSPRTIITDEKKLLRHLEKRANPSDENFRVNSENETSPSISVSETLMEGYLKLEAALMQRLGQDYEEKHIACQTMIDEIIKSYPKPLPENDPVYQHTQDQAIKSGLEMRTLPIESYLSELTNLIADKTIEIPDIELKGLIDTYQRTKLESTFPNFKKEYPYNGNEPLLVSEPSTVDYKRELIKTFRTPKHAAFLWALDAAFPGVEFEITKINLDNYAFPTYIIKFHLSDESNDGQGRNIRIQVNDQKKQPCYVDFNLPGESIKEIQLTDANNIYKLREALLNAIYPITPQVKQDYLDTMLLYYTLTRDEEKVLHYLELGASPTTHIKQDLPALMKTIVSLGFYKEGLNYEVASNMFSHLPLSQFGIGEPCLPLIQECLSNISLETYAHARKIVSEDPNIVHRYQESAWFIACSCHWFFNQNSKSYSYDLVIPKMSIVKAMAEYVDLNYCSNKSVRFADTLQKANALLYAIYDKNIALVRFLIENGANPGHVYTTENDEASTALAIALSIELNEEDPYSRRCMIKYFNEKTRFPISFFMQEALGIKDDYLLYYINKAARDVLERRKGEK